MSKKTELLVVGALSIALFTGFTGYSHFIGKGKPVPVSPKTSVSSSTALQPANGKNEVKPSPTLTLNMADPQVDPPVDPVPPDTARKKNTKTKAS